MLKSNLMINIIIILSLLFFSFTVLDGVIEKNDFKTFATIGVMYSFIGVLFFLMVKNPQLINKINTLNGRIPPSPPTMVILKENKGGFDANLLRVLNCEKSFEWFKFREVCTFQFEENNKIHEFTLKLTESDSGALKKLVNQKMKMSYVDFDLSSGETTRCLQNVFHENLITRKIKYLKYNMFNDLSTMFKYGCYKIVVSI